MSGDASSITRNSGSLSCFHTVKESKWSDAVLITGFIALLIIGILASIGVFDFMGTANAAYLCYGMYAGAALFILAEIIKVAISCSKKATQPVEGQSNQINVEKNDRTREKGKLKSAPVKRLDGAQILKDLQVKDSNERANQEVKQFRISNQCNDSYFCKHQCTITFTNDQSVSTTLEKGEIVTLKRVIDEKKVEVVVDDQSRFKKNDLDYHFQGQGTNESAREILKRVQQKQK